MSGSLPQLPVMAQKATKTLAARNTSTLNRTHLLTLFFHTLYNLSRFFRRSSNRQRILPYIFLSLPACLFEVYFERIARPTYTPNTGEVKRAGEDLDAKGLTEWMWDVVYWTYGCLVFVAVLGDRGWWAFAVVPLYSAWLAFSAYSGVRSGMGGLLGGGSESANPQAGQSKRQAKMEKRGGQKVQYR